MVRVQPDAGTALVFPHKILHRGAPVADGKIPGPITRKLIDAYSKDVGCDFVGQYLKFLQ